MTGTRRLRAVRLAVVAGVVGTLLVGAAPQSLAADVPLFPGSLADTPSATSAPGRGLFSGLSVHVNQTADLNSQAVSLSWSWPKHKTKNAYYSSSDTSAGWAGNYLQVMQCWGDAVTSAGTNDPAQAVNYVSDNEGPPREQCEFGGTAEAGGIDNFVSARQVSRQTGGLTTDPTYYGQESVYTSLSQSGVPEVPFKSVDGEVVAHQGNSTSWVNPNFGATSTNELFASPVFADGTGGSSFQVQNSLKSSSLGCGAENAAGTGLNKCWLVIVPRGDVTSIQNPKPFRDNSSFTPLQEEGKAVLSSPLASTLWQNRIAIPLDFAPVLSACADAQTNNLTVGSALPQSAMLSWQAALCRTDPTTGYTYTFSPDSVERTALTVPASDTDPAGSSSLELVSQPVPPSQVSAPITYAPLTLSGVAVSLLLEPGSFVLGTYAKQIPTVNLDQRLMAKLLTQSYRSANDYRLSESANGIPGVAGYSWLTKNPPGLVQDPEFKAINPDLFAAFPDLATQDDSFTGLMGGYIQVSSTGSDAYQRVWQWILADPDARAFLGGMADDSGMTVDPWYSTDASKNPTKVAFDPTSLDYFPVLDPWVGDPGGTAKSCTSPPVVEADYRVGNGDLRPYAADLGSVALNVSRVNNLNKAVLFNCPAPSTQPGWKGQYAPSAPGIRRAFGLSDTVSSAQYGVVTASLRNAAKKFVAPTTASLTAAAGHLVAQGGVEGVTQPDLATDDPLAYPLATITYGAVTTNAIPTASCAAYATLLDYAASDGQTPGTAVGSLPNGYAPLPARLAAQTADAAKTVAACAKVPVTPPAADPAPVDTTVVTNDGTTTGDVPAVTDAPADAAVTDNGTVASAAPPVSLAAVRGTTKPDPSVFAWVVPIAVGVGFLSLLLAPVAGLRRRRSDQPPSRGVG